MNFWDAFFVMVSVCLSTTLAAFAESIQPVGSAGVGAEVGMSREGVVANWVSHVLGMD